MAALDRAVSDPDAMVREAAAEAMERVAVSDVVRLGKMLRNDDDRVRVKAVKALGKLDDLRSLDLLLRAYGDPSKRVNKAVVEALAQREGERAYSILIAAAAGGNVRALRVLGEHPVRQAIPALLEALDSPWYEVYSAALESIRTYVSVLGDDPGAIAALRQAIPELVYLLHDDLAKARRLALEGLGAFSELSHGAQDPGAGQAPRVVDVAYLLLDRRGGVRFAAVNALASIGGSEAVDVLEARRSLGKWLLWDTTANLETNECC